MRVCHININVYLGRQCVCVCVVGGVAPINNMTHKFFILNSRQYVFCFVIHILVEYNP